MKKNRISNKLLQQISLQTRFWRSFLLFGRLKFFFCLNCFDSFHFHYYYRFLLFGEWVFLTFFQMMMIIVILMIDNDSKGFFSFLFNSKKYIRRNGKKNSFLKQFLRWVCIFSFIFISIIYWMCFFCVNFFYSFHSFLLMR